MVLLSQWKLWVAKYVHAIGKAIRPLFADPVTILARSSQKPSKIVLVSWLSSLHQATKFAIIHKRIIQLP